MARQLQRRVWATRRPMHGVGWTALLSARSQCHRLRVAIEFNTRHRHSPPSPTKWRPRPRLPSTYAARCSPTASTLRPWRSRSLCTPAFVARSLAARTLCIRRASRRGPGCLAKPSASRRVRLPDGRFSWDPMLGRETRTDTARCCSSSTSPPLSQPLKRASWWPSSLRCGVSTTTRRPSSCQSSFCPPRQRSAQRWRSRSAPARPWRRPAYPSTA